MTEQHSTEERVVWVLLDGPEGGDLRHFAGPLQIGVDKLKAHFQSFTSAIAETLEGCRSLAGDFELGEVTIKAKLSAEAGFVLISKVGIEGAVDFKFVKKR
jgi:hypothetical protein